MILSGILMMNAWASASTPNPAEYMGAYLNNAKVGWSSLAIAPVDELPSDAAKDIALLGAKTNPAWLTLCSESQLGVIAYGKRKSLYWKTLAYLNPDFSLAKFLFQLRSDDSQTDFKGEVTEGVILFSIDSAGEVRTEKVPVESSKVYLPECLARHLSVKIRQSESADTVYQILEPYQVSVSKWKVEVEGTEVLNLNGRAYETWRVKKDTGGFCPISWIDIEGRTIKEYAPLGDQVGYLSLVETEAEARNQNYLNPSASKAEDSPPIEPDLMHSTSVRTNKEIPRPSLVSRMKVELSHFRMERPFPFGLYQRDLSSGHSGAVTEESVLNLEILRATPPENSDPIGMGYPEPAARFLQTEPMVQSDHPEICLKARELTRNAITVWEAAEAIRGWMNQNIEPEFRITLPSAIEVLRTGKGDCNEQSSLFAALARAAGIPVKICTGLVYQRDAFYYHAWNEVLAQSATNLWIPVDPVMRQRTSDATHIKFGEGGLSEQSYITGLIGKIRVNILELESDDPDPIPVPPVRQ